MMMTRFTTMASTGRRMKMSVSFTERSFVELTILGRGRELRVENDLVVHGERNAILELERSRGDDFLSGLETFENGHVVTTRLAEADECLMRHLGHFLRFADRLHLGEKDRI